MKYIKIFDKLPGETKAVVATALLTFLTLQAKQDASKSKQGSDTKSKFTTFNTVYGTGLVSTYVILPNQFVKPNIGNNKSVADSLPLNIIGAMDTKKQTTEKISNEETAVKIIIGKRSVKYIYQDGTTELREGGTLPWRNKNPGAIRNSKMALGKANGFAVFASEEVGFEALRVLLRGEHYRNLTLKSAVFKYAPPHENNTSKYQSDIKRLTGIDLSRKLCDLNNEEFERVVKTIKQIEGWVPGKLTRIEAQTTKNMINDTVQYIR